MAVQLSTSRDAHHHSLAVYASREYLLEYGWRTDVRDDELVLRLDDGMTAVVLPADWALTALEDLSVLDRCCPVVLLPEGIRPHCVFLLEGSSADGDERLPAWLWRPWRSGESIPLPVGDSRSALRWLRSPDKAVGRAASVAVLEDVLARRFYGRSIGEFVVGRSA